MAVVQKFFISFFVVFSSILSVQASGFSSEKEVFDRYVYYDPFRMAEARVVTPRLLILREKEWEEAVSTFSVYLESTTWWERKASAEALTHLLTQEKIHEILSERNPQEARFLREHWWMRIDALLPYHKEHFLEYEEQKRAVEMLRSRIGVSTESVEVLHVYLSGITLMYKAFLKEESADNADFLLQSYQKVVTMDVDGNGDIDGQDYDQEIQKQNELDKIKLLSELGEKKKWLEEKMAGLTDDDWERWVSWVKDERFVGGITWRGEWEWRETQVGEWNHDFVLSAEKIASLIFALTDYKEHLESVLSIPEWRSAISREQFFLLIDSFFGPTAGSQEFKRKLLKVAHVPMREQFQYLLSYYGEEAPEEEGEVDLAPFFEKLKPSCVANPYEGKITVREGFASPTGFTAVEKFFLLQEYFSYLQIIYENYLAHHQSKSRDDFDFQQERWDHVAVSQETFEAGLNMCLESHPQFQFQQSGRSYHVSFSPLAKVTLEKQSHFDIGDSDVLQLSENALEEKVLDQARFETYEFLLKNKIVAVSSLPEFYTDPEALLPYVTIPHAINSEFRETRLDLPKLPISLGVDRAVPHAQFLFADEFAAFLMTLLREKNEKSFRNYRKNLEVALEKVVSPFYKGVNGPLYHDSGTPRNERVDIGVKPLE